MLASYDSVLHYLHSVLEDCYDLAALVIVDDGVIAVMEGAVLTSVGKCCVPAVGVPHEAISVTNDAVVAVAVGGVNHSD